MTLTLRTRSRRHLLRAAALLVCWCALPPASRADTVASLLGNFTINQYSGIVLGDSAVDIHYVVVLGQLPALRELHLADTDGDGVTSQAERDTYANALASHLARGLEVRIDGAPVALRPTHSSSSLPTEQGGFSLRLDVDFSGLLPAHASSAARRLQFANNNYQGRIGWHEIVVQAASPQMRIFNTNAFKTSLTNGLQEALQALPANGPLDERAIQLSYTEGALPPGAHEIESRPGAGAAASRATGTAAPSTEAAWLERETRRLVELISAPTVPPGVAILALLAAMVLGALHALSPGHGKTIVGAYLIGSHGTPRHAVFLGLTVTMTHTLGVFALGFATLFASRYVVPERLFPILSLVSGLLVFGMGLILVAQRWRGARRQARAHDHGHVHGHHHAHDHDHHHNHEHHDHEHAHDHGPHGALTHSHGGSAHSHTLPGADGARVTWRSLLALGISGGLIPCPSAMVLLLAAVALNKTAYGLLLVVAFSAGLAITLTVIGLAFLYARTRIHAPASLARWSHFLPVLSAALITVVGAALCIGALQGARL